MDFRYTEDVNVFISIFFHCFFSRQLIAQLKVFSKFLNPRSIYLERSLSELYNQVRSKIHINIIILSRKITGLL